MGLFDKFIKKEPKQDTVEWTVTLSDPQQEPQPKKDPAPVIRDNHYEFIVRSEDEKTDRALVRYQKFWTDPEDKYDGMTMMQFKEDGYPGDKIYQYPPLDVAVKLEAFLGEDGSVEISGFIDEGDRVIYVGKAAKTKAKKILRILQNEKPKITGLLYGGKYWKMESSGYVNNDWEDDLTLRVYFDY